VGLSVRGSPHREKVATPACGCTFRPLEQLYDPDDYRQLAYLVRDETRAANAASLKADVRRLVRARTWRWLLLHPDLDDSNLHPSRRVSFFCPPVPWCLLPRSSPARSSLSLLCVAHVRNG
jgi:hypothetical protein